MEMNPQLKQNFPSLVKTMMSDSLKAIVVMQALQIQILTIWKKKILIELNRNGSPNVMS